MASLWGRVAISSVRKSVLYPTIRCVKIKVTLGDPIEHATGLEKRELLARLAGNDDPYNAKPIIRRPNSKENPLEVPSVNDARIIGCVCQPDATFVCYMWVHSGPPRRCECGHWFKLVHREPL